MKNVAILSLVAAALIACGGSGGGGGATPAANRSPVANISVNDNMGYAPLTLTFDASASSDGDGSITEYSWDFGDGFTSVGNIVEHIFADLGDYAVTLTVTDNDGATDSIQTVINVHAQAAGFYFGTLNSTTTGQAQDLEVHIGSNYRLFGYGFPPSCTFATAYSGTMMMDNTSATALLLGDTRDPFCVFPDGTTIGDVNGVATIDARNGISAIYDGVGDQGTISLDYIAELSDKPASLSEISGVWSYSDGLGFSETMTVQPDGQFAASSSDGCNYSGTFSVIDPRLNEYEIVYDLTCPPGVNEAGDGRRIGNAFVDDFFYPEDWLAWSIIFQVGPLAGRMGGSALSRPRPETAAIVHQKTSSSVRQRERERSGRLFR